MFLKQFCVYLLMPENGYRILWSKLSLVWRPIPCMPPFLIPSSIFSAGLSGGGDHVTVTSGSVSRWGVMSLTIQFITPSKEGRERSENSARQLIYQVCVATIRGVFFFSEAVARKFVGVYYFHRFNCVSFACGT